MQEWVVLQFFYQVGRFDCELKMLPLSFTSPLPSFFPLYCSVLFSLTSLIYYLKHHLFSPFYVLLPLTFPVAFNVTFPCLFTPLVSSTPSLLIPSLLTNRAPSSHKRVWVVPLVPLWEAPQGWCPMLRQVWWVPVPRFLQHLLQLEHHPQPTLRSAS